MKVEYEPREKDIRITFVTEDRTIAPIIVLLVQSLESCVERGKAGTVDECFECMRQDFEKLDRAFRTIPLTAPVNK